MNATKIQWTDRTWNPVRGCSRVSEGCRNCYAERQAARFSDPGQYAHGFVKRTPSGPRWTGKVELVPSKLGEPRSWRKPSRVFVNSMSDLFHESLDFRAIAQVFGAMQTANQHTYQVLTKRPERMRAFVRWFADEWLLRGDWAKEYIHVWLGVSVEDQATADERIPLLLDTPAAVRFVSAEPLLGPVDLGLQSATCSCCPRWPSRWVRLRRPIGPDALPGGARAQSEHVADTGLYRAESNRHGALSVRTPGGLLGIKPSEFEALPGLDWVIVGGESGPGARPCDVEWIRSVVGQCRDANVPVFVKQLGAQPTADQREANEPWPAAVRFVGRGDGYADVRLCNRKGGDPLEWPEDLRVREMPA